jgi:hypothetical protein
MIPMRSRLGLVLLVIAPAVAAAQRPAPARRAAVRPDTVEHSPFIPGGRWRPGPPAPIPEPAPDNRAAAPAAAVDSAGYFARPNGLLLRPGTSVFQLLLHRDTSLVPLGTRTVTIAESTLAGVADWLVAETRVGTAIATSDSLHLHRPDLTPMRWTATNGLAQLAVSFTADSMFAALQDYQGRGSFAAGLPPGALITTGMVDGVLELLPLGSGYHTAASVVSIESGAPRAVPATIDVEREERIPLGAQPVDCWVVVLRAGTLEKRYWVAKAPQRVVKTEQQTPAGLMTETLVE